MIFPYSVDVALERWPIANWCIIAITIVLSAALFQDFKAVGPLSELPSWPFFGPGPFATDLGLLGHMFAHADWIHLAGNMLFLFVFGNAANAKLGQPLFIAAYIALGAVSAAASSLFIDGPGLGASGAISGLIGLFVVFYPRNNISVFYFFGVWARGVVEVSAWIVIGLYFAKDVLLHLLTGGADGVNYAAHISGTLAGVTLGFALLLLDRVRPTAAEQPLTQLLSPH